MSQLKPAAVSRPFSHAHSNTSTESTDSQPPIAKSKSISFGTLPTKINTADTNRRASQLEHDEEKAEVELTNCGPPFPQSPYPWQPKGYPRLALSMASEPTLAIFRRFGRLNALNLLALQADLLSLEAEYEEQLRADDLSRDEITRNLSNDFWELAHAPAPNDGQRRILEQIRPKLEAYNTALTQAAALDKLQRPLEGNVENLRGWLRAPDYGDNFLEKGGGRDHGHAAVHAHTYDPIWRDDFVTIEPDRPGEARLAKLLNPKLLRWYHTHLEPRLRPTRRRRWERAAGFHHAGWQGIGTVRASGDLQGPPGFRASYEARRSYLDRRDAIASWAGAVFSVAATLLASLLPVIAVLILFYVRHVEIRIAITIAFTVAFGLLLALCTNASLKEIFSATIAFAGLEVVFIGTNGVG